MKCVITPHAKDRILQRMSCRKSKVEKVVAKAWRSKQVICKNFIQKREYNGHLGSVYRLFCGYVFVFKISRNWMNLKKEVVLITVLKYDR